MEKPQLYQNWRDLLFLHWECPVDVIQKRLPEGLSVDTYQGKAYLAIVPFSMEALHLRGLPTFPGISSFSELNLRTYVVDRHGRPGVWFFSLEADSWISVKIANWAFSLPYRHSILHKQIEGQRVGYSAIARRDPGKVRMRFEFTRPDSVEVASPGSLEAFLVERYRLFTEKNGRLITGRIAHDPYRIGLPALSGYSTHMYRLNGFEPPSTHPDHILYSPGVDVSLFALERVS
jgi:uncharacterized protein YqjF (DUF2071 family)